MANTASRGLQNVGVNSHGKQLYLQPDAATALQVAAAQYQQMYGHPMQVNDAGRSYNEQAALYNQLHGKQAVARPGHSNHEAYNAVDIQDYARAMPILQANGFHWSNYKNDPWHFDYGNSRTTPVGTDSGTANPMVFNQPLPPAPQLTGDTGFDYSAALKQFANQTGTSDNGAVDKSVQAQVQSLRQQYPMPSAASVPDYSSAGNAATTSAAQAPVVLPFVPQEPQGGTNFFGDLGNHLGNALTGFTNDDAVRNSGGGFGSYLGDLTGGAGYAGLGALAGSAIPGVGNIMGGVGGAGLAGGLQTAQQDRLAGRGLDIGHVLGGAAIGAGLQALPVLRGASPLTQALKTAGLHGAAGGVAGAATDMLMSGKIDPGNVATMAALGTGGGLVAGAIHPIARKLSDIPGVEFSSKRLENQVNKAAGFPVKSPLQTGLGGGHLPVQDTMPGGVHVPDPAAAIEGMDLFPGSQPRTAPVQVTDNKFQPFVHGSPKPRVGGVVPEFKSDLDKSLYIIANRSDRNRSFADDKFFDFARKSMPGLTDDEILQVADHVKKNVVDTVNNPALPNVIKGAHVRAIDDLFPVHTPEVNVIKAEDAPPRRFNSNERSKIAGIDEQFNKASEGLTPPETGGMSIEHPMMPDAATPSVPMSFEFNGPKNRLNGWLNRLMIQEGLNDAEVKVTTAGGKSNVEINQTPHPPEVQQGIDAAKRSYKQAIADPAADVTALRKELEATKRRLIQNGATGSVEGGLHPNELRKALQSQKLASVGDEVPTSVPKVPDAQNTSIVEPPSGGASGFQIGEPPRGFTHIGGIDDLATAYPDAAEFHEGPREVLHGSDALTTHPAETTDVIGQAIAHNVANPDNPVSVSYRYVANVKGHTSSGRLTEFEHKTFTPFRFVEGPHGIAVEGLNQNGHPTTPYIDAHTSANSGFYDVPTINEPGSGSLKRNRTARAKALKSDEVRAASKTIQAMEELLPKNPKVKRIVKQFAKGSQADFDGIMAEIGKMKASGELDQILKKMEDVTGGC